jgi:RNase adaptor protein for sRNA GlmZ degradation
MGDDMQIKIFTHGYLHTLPNWVPTQDIEVDLRDQLFDPAHVPSGELLDMRGDLDPQVRAFVLATKGAPELLARVTREVLDELAGWDAELDGEGDLVVMIGCAGGKHRAASFGVFLAVLLRAAGFTVELRHLHAHLPRVIK